VAQVAAAALLIDYVVTVAVQTAAGTVAVLSAVPSLVRTACKSPSGGACHLLREPARVEGSGLAVRIRHLLLRAHGRRDDCGGFARIMFGDLPVYDPTQMPGTVDVHQGNGLVMGATVLVLLRAFANGVRH